MQLLREAGFVYARTTENLARVLPCADTMALHSNCHFMSPEFWNIFEAARSRGVFYFLGHSYEMMEGPKLWREYEDKLRRFVADPDIEWVNVVDLVADRK